MSPRRAVEVEALVPKDARTTTAPQNSSAPSRVLAAAAHIGLEGRAHGEREQRGRHDDARQAEASEAEVRDVAAFEPPQAEQEGRHRAGNDQEGDQALPAERRLRVEREDRSGGEEKVRDRVSQPRDEADSVRVRDRQRDGTEREEGHGDRQERAGQLVDGRAATSASVSQGSRTDSLSRRAVMGRQRGAKTKFAVKKPPGWTGA
jgi:hypothetical protein